MVAGKDPVLEQIAFNDYSPFVSKRKPGFGQWKEKWTRRVMTIPITLFLFLLFAIFAPIVMPLLILLDFIRGRIQLSVKVYSFFLSYLFTEISGIIVSFFIYLGYLIVRPSRETWVRWNLYWQGIWGGYMLFGNSIRSCSVKIEVEGLEDVIHPWDYAYERRSKRPDEKSNHTIKPGPFILFMRHSSTGDTLYPQGIFARNFAMRYIVKKELIFDAGLDVHGSRTPNLFLNRSGKGDFMKKQVDAMRNMLSDLSPGDNVVTVIWPEGTRFTKAKKKRVLEKLREIGDEDQAQWAESLVSTMPPRLKGMLELLDGNPCCDILFCAHVGLEHSASFWEFLNGNLVDGVLRLKFFRVPFEKVPKVKEERVKFLRNMWQKVDKWVSDNGGHPDSLPQHLKRRKQHTN